MKEAICGGSRHSSGYWLASWYTCHSVCLPLEDGMSEGVCLIERDHLFPHDHEGTERAGRVRREHKRDRTGQKKGEKNKFVHAKEDRTRHDGSN